MKIWFKCCQFGGQVYEEYFISKIIILSRHFWDVIEIYEIDFKHEVLLSTY